MSGFWEGYKIKASKWDVIENNMAYCDDNKLLDLVGDTKITYSEDLDDDLHGGGSAVETIEKEKDDIVTEYKETVYSAAYMLMYNMETILVDERACYCVQHGVELKNPAPKDVRIYEIKRIDKNTGKTIFETEIADDPTIVYDIKAYEKEHFKDKDETKLIEDKAELLKLMNEVSPKLYEIASEELKNNKEIIDKLLSSDYWGALALLPDKYLYDKEFLLGAIKQNKALPLDRFNEEFLKDLLSDVCFIEKAFKLNKDFLSYEANEYFLDTYATNEVQNKLEELENNKETKDLGNDEKPF